MEFIFFAMAWAKMHANETERAAIGRLLEAYYEYLKENIDTERSGLGLKPLDWDEEQRKFKERNSQLLNTTK